ncbi:MAG: histidine kinase [Clostridiales bacterium]|nr:histidine kinase [Clostridiales bacterium]
MSIWSRKPDKTYYNATITNVLLGSYIRVMIISMVLGIVIFIGITSKELTHRQAINNDKSLGIVTYIINSKLDDIKIFADELVVDDELHDIFTRNHDIRNNLLGSLIMRRMAQQDLISSVHIICEDSIVSEFKYPVYNFDQKKTIDNLSIDENHSLRGDFYWEIGTDNVEVDRNIIYLVSNIRSKDMMEHLGYLVVFMDINQLQGEIMKYLDKENEILIKSASDKVITFPGNISSASLGKDLQMLKAYEDNLGEMPDRYSANILSSIDGIIMISSKQSIHGNNVEFAIVFMLIVIIGFTIIASVVLKKRVIVPLEIIAERAKEITNEGNLNISFPNEKYYSEADDISNALNEMMSQIRGLMEDVENREKLQRQLELSVINHQIKPHFLYNTLNAASILVSVEEKESAKQLITTLASYYRACLNHGNDIISLEGELGIVQDYIKIALIRNPNILILNKDIDESLLSLQIPKMTIQTLVENSIKYGIKTIGQPVNISIIVRRREDYAEIIVEDDGVGMSPVTIDRIMSGEQLDVKSGFGLKSVLNRLALLYETKDMNEIMEIQSEANSYTRIILKVACN